MVTNSNPCVYARRLDLRPTTPHPVCLVCFRSLALTLTLALTLALTLTLTLPLSLFPPPQVVRNRDTAHDGDSTRTNSIRVLVFTSRKQFRLHHFPLSRICQVRYPCVMCHQSSVICLLSCVMCHVSCVMCHVSSVMCHVSCVMCHLSRGDLQVGASRDI